MSTAIAIAAEAYRRAKLDQPLTTFDATLEYPYNLAKDLFNSVIREMNRKGRFWFAETSQALAYSAGVYAYNLTSLGIDPKAIRIVRRETSGYEADLSPMSIVSFLRVYRRSTLLTQMPEAYAIMGAALNLSTIPDLDYGLKVYYFRDLPLVTATTDTMICQESDEDVFIEGIAAQVMKAIGRSDWQAQYQLYMDRVKELLADQKQDTRLPLVMPAQF